MALAYMKFSYDNHNYVIMYNQKESTKQSVDYETDVAAYVVFASGLGVILVCPCVGYDISPKFSWWA